MIKPEMSPVYAFALKRVIKGEKGPGDSPFGRLCDAVKCEIGRDRPRLGVLCGYLWILKEVFLLDEFQEVIKDTLNGLQLPIEGADEHGVDVDTFAVVKIGPDSKRIGTTSRVGVFGEELVLMQSGDHVLVTIKIQG